MSNGEPLDQRCSGTHEAWMFYLQKNLWRVWKLHIITKTTPKPLDLTSNGVKTRITIVYKLWGGCDILCRYHLFVNLQNTCNSCHYLSNRAKCLFKKTSYTEISEQHTGVPLVIDQIWT